MTKILIGYGTTEGQTARIAQRLAQVIRSRGVEVQVMDLKRSPDPDLDTYDAVIIGGSIHMGKHEDYVCDFVSSEPCCARTSSRRVLLGEPCRSWRYGER